MEIIMPRTKYDYKREFIIDDNINVETAIEYSILNYMHNQLGWSIEKCKERIKFENERVLPKKYFNYLETLGWSFNGKKVIDIGSGQGSAVLEALFRGANAFGIEPGEEFSKLSRMRLKDAGFNENHILTIGGENIPFKSNSFDYAINLYVLEHVSNPDAILQEIFRILKPGGKFYLACENYLSFREEHYKIVWFPMLPKALASIYLKSLGRNPYFLKNYVYYTTYPQIVRSAKKAGFKNITKDEPYQAIRRLYNSTIPWKKISANFLNISPEFIINKIISGYRNLKNTFRVGVTLLLEKPKNR
jgi:ubiquinone/menaquinone biosynthesis C-methylase UbiE